MFASGHSKRGSIFKGFFVLAGAAGIAPAAALAVECKLSVHASPQVLWGDQDTHVDVLAHFPSLPAPDGAYAFASSAFDVYASDPMWTLVSAGAIVGNDVLGISADQAHAPQLADPADPTNPIRVWHGVFEPQSDAPALIEIEADPADFFVYPSKLTSSSAECDAVGGSDFVFVNPLRVGGWLAAPGAGTEVRTGDDVIIDGRIITGENPAGPVRIGMLHPAIQKVRDSSTRVEFDGQPEAFSATVQLVQAPRRPVGSSGHLITGTDEIALGARRSPSGNMTVTFDGLETGGYAVGGNYMLMDGSVRNFSYDGFLGGVRVASGILEPDADGLNQGLVVESLPQTFEASVGSRRLNLAAANTSGGSTSAGDLGIWQDNYGTTLRYDQPVNAVVPGPNGQPVGVKIDFVLVSGGQAPAAALTLQNNLKQLSLGSHVFEAEGVRQMSVTPRQYP